jgi:hypothetical protein
VKDVVVPYNVSKKSKTLFSFDKKKLLDEKEEKPE